MKLRLFHKTAVLLLLTLSALGFVFRLPDSQFKTLSLYLIGMVFIWNLSVIIWQYARLYLIGAEMEVLSDFGYKYMMSKIKVFDNIKGDYRNLLIAGVIEEVDESSSPAFYAMPSHIDYVINQEDLVLNNNEKVINIINSIYKTNYTAL